MTIYEPNDDVRPTGAEVDEFVDAPQPVETDDEEDDEPSDNSRRSGPASSGFGEEA